MAHRVLPLVLLCFCTAGIATAADFEQLTLRDGRVLTGHYDELRGVLVMDNPHAEVRIDARDIAKREEAAPPVAKPKPEVAEGASPGVPAGADELKALDAKVSDLHAQAAALERQAKEVRAEGYRRWLLAANLDPAVIPKLGDDPTVSQVKRANELDKLNMFLDQLRHVKVKLGMAGMDFSRTGDDQVVDDFVHGSTYALYLETRAAGQHAAAPPAPAEPSRPKKH